MAKSHPVLSQKEGLLNRKAAEQSLTFEEVAR
jgi:hypothetical protein